MNALSTVRYGHIVRPAHGVSLRGMCRKLNVDLNASIEKGRLLGKQALYFGCWEQSGHYLHKPGGSTIYRHEKVFPDLPWADPHMDTGLLDNGKHRDVCDGKVFWTCGGAKAFWYAFFWWDRSIDTRSNSNSGFYVRGFGWPEQQLAFDYACEKFPKVVSRQKYTLVLQGV